VSTDLDRAFERAAEARAAIAEIIRAVRSGDIELPEAWERADADPLTGRCFAVKVLEAVPGIGKVRARRTMADIGVDEDVWLAEVPPQARVAIAAAFADPDPDGTGTAP